MGCSSSIPSEKPEKPMPKMPMPEMEKNNCMNGPIVERFKQKDSKNVFESNKSVLLNYEPFYKRKKNNNNTINSKNEGKEKFNDNKSFEKIIDFSDVKTGDININLIHYDKQIKNKENFEYYRYFSIKLKGSYFSFDDYDMVKLFLSRQSQIPFSPNYILMISGNESEKILNEYHHCDFLNDIILFCFEKNKYEELKNKYNKIRLVSNDFVEVVHFLKSQKHSKEDLNMDNHLFTTPLITYFDYKKLIFPIHRVISHFFAPNFINFTKDYFTIAKKFIDKSTETTETKNKIINIMEKLVDSKNFPVDCIKYYTGENLCYIFNKALRNFEKNYIEMSYFIGPFYFGIFRYALMHPEKQLNEKKILYRDITIDRLDLYSYQFSEKDIICFPSFTSTTLKKDLNFVPTSNANLINNDQIEDKGYAKMLITYDPKGKCEPQGLDVSDEAEFSNEKEILLFPFTFFRIDKVEIHSGKVNDKHIIYLTIINKGDIIEFGLNQKFAFKLIENGTKLVIDYNNKSSCDNNEEFYKINFDHIDKKLL